MHPRIRPIFQWALIFVVNLPRLTFLCFDKLKQSKNCSQLVITIKYHHAGRMFLSILKKKKNYVQQNTGPLNCSSCEINGNTLKFGMQIHDLILYLGLEFYKRRPNEIPPGYYKVQVLCTTKYGFELCFMHTLDIIFTFLVNVIWFVGS